MVTSYPLECVFRNSSASGRVAEWLMELLGFDLRFLNTTAIKSLALANFIVEWTPTPTGEEDVET